MVDQFVLIRDCASVVNNRPKTCDDTYLHCSRKKSRPLGLGTSVAASCVQLCRKRRNDYSQASRLRILVKGDRAFSKGRCRSSTLQGLLRATMLWLQTVIIAASHLSTPNRTRCCVPDSTYQPPGWYSRGVGELSLRCGESTLVNGPALRQNDSASRFSSTMAQESKRRHPVRFVILQAGSAVAGSISGDTGNYTTTPKPERTVEAPSPTSSSSSSSGGSSITDEELGIIVGGGLMLLVMVSILFVGHRRRHRMNKDIVPSPSPGTLDASDGRSPGDNDQDLYALDSSSCLSSPISFNSQVSIVLQEEAGVCESWNHPEVVAVRISVSEISLDELVARGTNSEVYRGQYREQVVAVKKPLPQWLGNSKNVDAFFERVRLLSSPSLTHPGIVSFLGVSWRSIIYVCMVSEFMAGGDLHSFLIRRKHQAGFVRDGFGRRGFSRQKVYLASQIASALGFLHAQGLVHGAVRSQNVLLDEHLNAKLTSYQGSSIKPAFDPTKASNDAAFTAVPPKLLTASVPIAVADRLRREQSRREALWSSPEVLRGERSNAKTDVFSFGVMLSVLDSLTAPYGHSSRFSEHSDSAELLEKVAAGHVRVHFASSRVRHGRRGSSSPAEVDSRLTTAVVRLGKACVALDAFERPSAAQVSAELHKLLQAQDLKVSRTMSKHGSTAARH